MNYVDDGWKQQVRPRWKESERLLFEQWCTENNFDFKRKEEETDSAADEYASDETQARWEHWQKERLKVMWQNMPETVEKMGYEDQPSDVAGDLFHAIYIAGWVFSLVTLMVGIGYLVWATFDPSVPFR